MPIPRPVPALTSPALPTHKHPCLRLPAPNKEAQKRPRVTVLESSPHEGWWLEDKHPRFLTPSVEKLGGIFQPMSQSHPAGPTPSCPQVVNDLIMNWLLTLGPSLASSHSPWVLFKITSKINYLPSNPCFRILPASGRIQTDTAFCSFWSSEWEPLHLNHISCFFPSSAAVFFILSSTIFPQ